MTRRMRAAAVLAPLAALALIAGCASPTVAEASGLDKGGSSAGPDFSSIIPEGDIVAASQQMVDASIKAREGFTPPGDGPQAQDEGATVAFVGSDLTNGGINAVSDGVREAATAIGWNVTAYDGKATAQGRSDAMQQAISAAPAAIIVGGFDPAEQAVVIKQAGDAGIPVVGWHAGPEPGSGNGLFTNVTTNPLDVSQLAAAYAVARSEGTAGVAIFTDGQYEIAVLKADAMEAYISACPGCTVLEYQDSPISESDQRMPGLVSNMLQAHAGKLTYLLAINGNYFGGAQQALRAAGVPPEGPPYSVAAGDGDAAEFQRIRNQDYQAATVAEPLYLQGWQLVDEVNRALAGDEPGTFVPRPGLVTVENVPTGDVFDPDSGYRDVYLESWGK